MCVYPIKVNQQRQVVEEVLEFGRPFGFGLEAGSKPELLAVVALADNETPIICNGFKDAEFIEMAMLAQKIGRRIIPVVEKYTELPLILEYAERVGVRPTIGMRVKLAARGSGRWQSSGGYPVEVRPDRRGDPAGPRGTEGPRHGGLLSAAPLSPRQPDPQYPYRQSRVERGGTGVRRAGQGGRGPEIPGRRRRPRRGLRRIADQFRVERELHPSGICERRRVSPPDRVRRGQGAAPDIVSESGRAIVAHHSLLVFNVLDVSALGDEVVPATPAPDMEQPLTDLIETHDGLTSRNALESYHDAQQALDMAMNLFPGGYLPLEQRSTAENLYWAICMKLQKLVQTMDEVPEDLQGLDESLSDTYFCNFSIFQSIPDSWAIKQLFPIIPIHRLNERPTRHAVLGDITCDSDGKVDQFIDRRDVSARCGCTRSTARPTISASFSWARTRRSSAISTICWATPTRST